MNDIKKEIEKLKKDLEIEQELSNIDEFYINIIGKALIKYPYYKLRCKELEIELLEMKQKLDEEFKQSFKHSQEMMSSQINFLLNDDVSIKIKKD